jgi:hypothetical protein
MTVKMLRKNQEANLKAVFGEKSIYSYIDGEKTSKTIKIEGVGGLPTVVSSDKKLTTSLKAGDVIVLDNLGAHRASRIEEIAQECGARVIRLPPYSPDFSPIELLWSKVKAY